MKFRIFTKVHPEGGIIKCNDKRFTSDESTQLIHQMSPDKCTSKERILRELLQKESPKLIALDFLIQSIQKGGYKSILSLGSGSCAIESLLSGALPETATITATDFNDFFIGRARTCFPEIISEKFDFYHDAIPELSKKTGIRYDFAYFLNSAYVMDDEEFISLLSQLRDAGVREIADLSSAFVPWYRLPREIMGDIRYELTGAFRGKFHGYMRTRNDFRRIYRKSGLTIGQECSLGPYRYVAILKNPGT